MYLGWGSAVQGRLLRHIENVGDLRARKTEAER